MKTKRTHHAILLILVHLTSPLASAAEPPQTAEVDVLRYVDRQFKGKLFRGASVPFGMMLIRPARGLPKAMRPLERREGFTLCGFSGASMPTGNYDVYLLPSVGGPEQVWLSESKEGMRPAVNSDEYLREPVTLEPGYFRKTFDKQGGATVELTATTRTSSGRITYPASAATGTFLFMPLAVDGKAEVKIGTDRLTSTSATNRASVFHGSTPGWASPRNCKTSLAAALAVNTPPAWWAMTTLARFPPGACSC